MTLTQLAAGLPVDVMPGEGDPASAALPQQPLHRRAPPVRRVCTHRARVARGLQCAASRSHRVSSHDVIAGKQLARLWQ